MNSEPSKNPGILGIALKEQGIILDALLRGESLCIFRKGGIIEPDGGEFRALSPKFWMFPTIIHQREEDLSETLLPFAEKAKAKYQHIENTIPFFCVGEIVAKWYLEDEALLEKVLPFSPLSLSCLKDRFYFGKNKGVWMLLLKVFRTEKAWEEPYTQLHSGCKSWVDLPLPLETGALTQVLEEEKLQELILQLNALIGQ